MLENKLQEARNKAFTSRLALIGIVIATALVVALSIVSINLYQDLETLQEQKDGALSPSPGQQIDKKEISPPSKTLLIPQSDLKRHQVLSKTQKPNVPALKSAIPFPSSSITALKISPEQQTQSKKINERVVTLSSKPIERGDVTLKEEPRQESEASAHLLEFIKPSQPITSEIESTVRERQLFKEELKFFEDELAPKIQSEGFSNWNPETQEDLLFLKEKAVSSFGMGEFKQALQHIRNVTEIGQQELTDKEKTYQAALKLAQNDKDNDVYKSAKLNIERALFLRPDSQEARHLGNEISKLPEMLKLLDDVEVAKSENNTQIEYDLLTKVLRFQPERISAKKRVGFLARKIQEHRYTVAINKGLRYVKDKHLSKAQKQLTIASKIHPKRDETLLLIQAVTYLEKDQKTQSFIAKANDASVSDNWALSRDLFGKAKVIQPNNSDAVEGYELSVSIIAANDLLSKFIDYPHRLSSMKIIKAATLAIGQAVPMAEYSHSLSKKSHELSEYIKAYSKMVYVQIISDEQTYISVRGVGQVGVIREKIIQLRPGKYMFVGKRKGYKSKLVRVVIPLGDPQFQIKLVCDERV